MPLVAPANKWKELKIPIIILSCSIVLYVLTRSTLPYSGDNIHALPHGGKYCDGTKTILYNKPGGSYPSIKLPLNLPIILLPLSLIIILHAINRSNQNNTVCTRCNNSNN
uniref:Movement protein TGB2 n=1 Tax=Cymodocea nodosa foveavirus 1 TaxID=2794432 RepID=A0A7T5QZ79_9VIRU|nr:TGB2 [Cymodocea nodosa foveavirus 1]